MRCIFTGSVKLRAKNIANSGQTESWNGFIHFSVGECHILSEKTYLFLPVFAKLDRISLEVLLKWRSKEKKLQMLYIQQPIFFIVCLDGFVSLFNLAFQRIVRLKLLAWADTIQNPFSVQPWLCKLNLEFIVRFNFLFLRNQELPSVVFNN